jgi:Ala-tRNA(Pro) deacylase
MAHTPETLLAYLDSLGIAHKTVTHPPVFTVEQAKKLRGEIVGAADPRTRGALAAGY